MKSTKVNTKAKKKDVIGADQLDASRKKAEAAKGQLHFAAGRAGSGQSKVR